MAIAGVLPSSSASPVMAAAVSSEVWRPADDLDELQNMGTGLKKCMPITRSGRPVAAASDVIGIEEVFEARMPAAGKSSSARRNTSSFTAAFSTTASTIRSAGTSSADGRDSGEHLVGRRPALLGEPGKALPHGLEAALGRAGRSVMKRDTPAGGGDDLRDPGAHLAGSHDEDVRELHGNGN